jgi:hypothetical protein
MHQTNSNQSMHQEASKLALTIWADVVSLTTVVLARHTKQHCADRLHLQLLQFSEGPRLLKTAPLCQVQATQRPSPGMAAACVLNCDQHSPTLLG